MKVRELIKILGACDQETEVIAIHDHETKGPVPYELDNVSIVKLVRDRDAHGRATCRADNEEGWPFVVIELAGDL